MKMRLFSSSSRCISCVVSSPVGAQGGVGAGEGVSAEIGPQQRQVGEIPGGFARNPSHACDSRNRRLHQRLRSAKGYRIKAVVRNSPI